MVLLDSVKLQWPQGYVSTKLSNLKTVSRFNVLLIQVAMPNDFFQTPF